MPSITSVNVANAITRLVAADALPALVGSLVMGNLVRRDYEPELAQVGDTFNVPIAPQLVANNLAHGGTIQLQRPSLGNAQVVLNTHAEASFGVPDVTKILAVPDLLAIYMKPAVVAIAEKIETDLLNLYAGFTANAPLGTAGLPITEATLDYAEATLFGAKVPMSTPKFLVVDGNAYSAMRQIPRFSEYRNTGEAGLRAIIDGTFGKIKDFFVFRSQYVQNTGTAPVAIHNLAFCKDAIALVVRRLPQPPSGTGAVAEYAELGNFGMQVTMHYQPNTLSQQFTINVLYGCGILRNEFGVQVTT